RELAAVGGVRGGQRRRSSLAVSPQAGPDRRRTRADRIASPPHLSSDNRRERRGELRGLMRKTLHEITAGLIVGLLSAAIIIIADELFTRVGDAAINPLTTFELKTYDWRMSATARADAARKDIALVEIDERSLRNLQPNAGRWPWPRAVHMMLVDYLARGPAKVVAYDINFAEADTRRGFDFGGGSISGKESDDQLVESVRAAGNVILLADATYQGEVTGFPPLSDMGYG